MRVISIANRSDKLKPAYAINALSKLWAEQGLDVRVGRGFADDAELCILHLDQTRIEQSRIPPSPAGVPVLNRNVLDISKRLYSRLLLTPDSDWDGQVIIKTDANHFGKPERRSQPKTWRSWLGSKAAGISWRHAGRLPDLTYPVLPHMRKVPGWVWANPDLIVEKFMPERDGELFCLRGWMFFGSKGYGYRLFSTDPMVKTETRVKHEYIDEAPPEIQAYRETAGFDFGKFDYVVHEGVPILLDANKTAGFSGDGTSVRFRALAEGIWDFLK